MKTHALLACLLLLALPAATALDAPEAPALDTETDMLCGPATWDHCRAAVAACLIVFSPTVCTFVAILA